MMVFDFANKHEISMYYNFFAPELSRVISEVLRPGDCFVDCGANIGYFTFLASSIVGETGKVITIDPNPYCIERIRESKQIGEYGNINIVEGAVGDCNGETLFNIADDPMYSSLADLDKLSFAKTRDTIMCSLYMLDNLLNEWLENSGEKVRLLKLDVEGAEVDAIRGAYSSISAGRIEYIFVEMHEKQLNLRGQKSEEFHEFLSHRGYEIVGNFSSDDTYLYKSGSA